MRNRAIVSAQRCIHHYDDSEYVPFYSSSVKDGVREIKDEKGNVIAREAVKVPSLRALSPSDFIHTEDSSLYSVEKLDAAGITPSTAPIDFISLNLFEKSQISSFVNSESGLEKISEACGVDDIEKAL